MEQGAKEGKGGYVVDQTRSILPFVKPKSAQSMKANPIIGDWQTFYRQIHIEGLRAYCLLLSLEMKNNGELGWVIPSAGRSEVFQ